MHPRVEFQVDGEVGDALAACGAYERIEEVEAIDLGLEFIFEERAERRHFRVHHDDARRDARAAQLCAFIRHGNCEIVHAALLQRLGNLHAARAVGRGLHHTGEFRFRLHE